jgi:NADPH:quinone reductase-like Zn-dependent oxidoreductase
VVVPADRIALSPPGLPPSEAASLVVAATTALTALRDSAGLVSGERVLIRGAAGGVGTAAVQLARAMGGHVTALARGECAVPLADLGADEIIDYRSSGPEQTGPFDVIIDTAGSDLRRYRRRLTRHGRMVTVGLSAAALTVIALSSVHGSRRIRTFSANPQTAILDDLSGYVTSGALRPVVNTVYPLSDIAAAHRAFSAGGALGKQVITVP